MPLVRSAKSPPARSAAPPARFAKYFAALSARSPARCPNSDIPLSPHTRRSGFADAATRVMNQMNKMDFESVWSNVQSIAESTARLTANVDSLVEGQRAAVGSIVQSVSDAAERLGELARRLEENPSLLLRPADPEPLPETSANR